MFICSNCGCVFSEDEVLTIEERHPYGDGYASEYFSCCPSCKDNSFDEAVQCEFCDEYHPESEMHDGVCDHCYEELKQRVAKAIYKEFTQGEFDALPEDVFEDIWEDVEKLYKMGSVSK